MIETGNMRAGGNEMNRKARMKKCMVFFLSIAMVLAMSVPAFAAEGGATGVAKIGEQTYDTLADAITASKEGDEIELIADIDNSVDNAGYNAGLNYTLKKGTVLNGAGHTVSGHVGISIPAAGATVENINFKNIHNNTEVSETDCKKYGLDSKTGSQSAVYANGLTGKAVITGCTFDNIDWDAIQITPASTTAAIEISGNIFEHTDASMTQLRYVHVEHVKASTMGSKIKEILITDNQFYKSENKHSTGSINIWYISSSTPTVRLDSNYIEDRNTVDIGKLKKSVLYPMRLNPTADGGYYMPVAYSGSNIYDTLKDAIDDTSKATFYLMKDCDEDITIAKGRGIDLTVGSYKLTGEITNNGTLTISIGSDNGNAGNIVNNGKLNLKCNAATGYSVENNGTLNISSGETYDLSKITGNGKIVITGGTFTTKPDSSMLGEWYIAKVQQDGTYKVSLMTVSEGVDAGMAASSKKAGGTYYKSITEAANGSEKSLYLQKDSDEEVHFNQTSSYRTFYLNNKVFTGSIIMSETTDYVRLVDSSAVLKEAVGNELKIGKIREAADVTIKDAKLGILDVDASGVCKVQGGIYDNVIVHDYYNQGETDPIFSAQLSLTGGTFKSDKVTIQYANHTVGDSGATSEEVPLNNYLEEGYRVVANDDGTYTVKPIVATIGTGDNIQEFTSLNEALAKAEITGDKVVTLISNAAIDENEAVEIPAGVTLNIENNIALTNNGRLVNNGTIDNNGEINNVGTIESYGAFNGAVPTEGIVELHVQTLSFEGLDTSNKLSMAIGDDKALEISKSPENAVDELKWESSDSNIIAVDSNGNVTAKAVGEAVITVTANGKSANCTVIVNRKAAPAAPTGIQGINETVKGRNDGKITGVTDKMEYRKKTDSNNENWILCENETISNLAPGTYEVRIAETHDTEAGLIADVTIETGAEPTYTLNVTVPAFDTVEYGYEQPAAKPITISSTGNSDAAIDGVTVNDVDGKAAFMIAGNGSNITAGAQIDTWTIQPAANLNAGDYKATVTVTYDNNATATAEVTFTVSPAAQEAPAKAEIKDSTYTTITLTKIDANKNGAAAKYSSDGGKTWQDSNVFENLLPGTEYTFVVRYDATKDGNYAESPVSEELKVSTKTGATAVTVTQDDRKALSDEKSELEKALENGAYSDADKAKLKQRISEIDVALSKLDSGSDSGADFSDDTNPADNSCNADLAGSENDLIDALLTDEEKNELENGKDVKVWLKVTDISATVSEPDKDLVDTKRGNATVGMYLDIDLLKQIGSDPSQNITETNDPVTITLKVPDTLVNTDASVTRTYQMIRVHDGKVTVIPCNYDAAKQTISFETDQFSTYALAYVDRQNSSGGGNITDTAKPGDTAKPAATDPNAGAATDTQTGDSSNLLLWFTLLFLSGFGVTATIMASRKKKASR